MGGLRTHPRSNACCSSRCGPANAYRSTLRTLLRPVLLALNCWGCDAAIDGRPALALREVAVRELPDGYVPTDVRFLDGDRWVAWSAVTNEVVMLDSSETGQHVLTSDRPVAAIRRDGTIEHDVGPRGLPLLGTTTQELAHATDSSAGKLIGAVNLSTHLVFIQRDLDRIVLRSPEWIADGRLPVRDVGELVGGASPGGALLQEFTPPHRLIRATPTGDHEGLRFSMLDAPALPSAQMAEWRGLRPLSLGRGLILQTFSNLVDGRRFTALRRIDGEVVRTRQFQHAIAFHDADTIGGRLLAVRHAQGRFSLVAVAYTLNVP